MSFDFYLMTAPTTPRAAQPSHRHGTPSGPWPFLDLTDEVDPAQLSAPQTRAQDEEQEHEWNRYPQSLFPNWTYFQQKKSGIAKLVAKRGASYKPCSVYRLDVKEDATFHGNEGEGWQWKVADEASREAFWGSLQQHPEPSVRVRAYFVDDLNGPVLQMLGTKFDIEPFFFSSALSNIPTRFQSLNQQGTGDHLTLTLSFICALPLPDTSEDTASVVPAEFNSASLKLTDQVIDTQGPLRLHSKPKILVPDLFAVHVIRRVVPSYALASAGLSPRTPRTPRTPRPTMPVFESDESVFRGEKISTIISYHPPSSHQYPTTSAAKLHERLLAAGHSVYWNKIFKSTVPSGDPTFVLLSLLWYALYAWDEALENLVNEVTLLEYKTLSTLPKSANVNPDAHENTQRLTHQLHVIRAHLLHYEGLLDDFRKSVTFVLATPHPGLPSTRRTPNVGRSDSMSVHSPMSEYIPSPPPSARRSRRRSIPQPLAFERSRIPVRRGTSSSQTERQQQQPLPPEKDIYLSGAPYDDSDEESTTDRLNAETLQQLLETSEALLAKEANNLINEIERLEMTRKMLDKRLGNVMALAFSSVNIEDSKRMAKMTQAAVRDSAAIKQISYLTMFFLPATFLAGVFGMNVAEINPGTYGTLGHYFAAAIPMTAVTVFVMMFQYQYSKTKALEKSRAEAAQEGMLYSPIETKKSWWPTQAFERVAGWLQPPNLWAQKRKRRRSSVATHSSSRRRTLIMENGTAA